MKRALACAACVVPVLGFAQYIGNPAGKAIPLGVTQTAFALGTGYAALEGGYLTMDVEAAYDTTLGVIEETSTLEEGYFAVVVGGNIEGLEIEAKIGGSFQELQEDWFDEDPFSDGGGIMTGMGARYGFSPFYPFRFGLGGQFQFVYSEGDSYVSSGTFVSHEEIELLVWRAQLFGGVSADLQLGNEVTLSPYIGAGGEFMDGDITLDRYYGCPYGCYWDVEEIGDIDEDAIEIFFGGVDLHLSEEFFLGVEGRGNNAGWVVGGHVGFRF
jgi:opacity protein-like surface antigen